MGGEISPSRLRIAKICLVAGGVALLGGIVFAVLENGAENDYEKAAPGNQANLDSISSRGRRDAAIADLGFALAGVAVVGAVFAGYPMFIKPSAEKTEAAPATAFVAPLLGRGLAGGALSVRF
jgi:hypothetical protein